MNLHDELEALAKRSVQASRFLALLRPENKNKILLEIAKELENRFPEIAAANAFDLKDGKEKGLSASLLDRLKLDKQRLATIASSLRALVELPDPVGRVLAEWTRPNALQITKLSVPIGVIAIIYESRPNVTVDAASLCIKSSNAVILRGGSEAINTNLVLAQVMQEGGKRAGLPDDAVQFVQTTDRHAVRELVQLEGLIDLVIPRGGEGLVRTVTELSRVPVIKHYRGVCHVYVDEAADLKMALAITLNAKCQRPGVCNAMETLLVHEKVAPSFLPLAIAALAEKGVELRGDKTAQALAPLIIKEATEEDWHAEYLDLILAIRVVPSLTAAIEHINNYGSRHSDAIVSENPQALERFLQEVDSAAVFANSSTRFNDGGEFGMGAEMGISTDKIHARGPMGLEELTSYKYLVRGQGQIRQS